MIRLIHKNSKEKKVFKMNRMYPINYNIKHLYEGGGFKYSIILNIKTIYKVGKLNKRLVF